MLTLLLIAFMVGYVICLWLTVNALQVMRKFLKKETEEGINDRAACLNLTVILLFLLSHMFRQVMVY